MAALALPAATPVLSCATLFWALAVVQLRVLPYTALRIAVIEVRACLRASLPASSCFRASSSRSRLRFLLDRSSMAAASAFPTVGPEADVVAGGAGFVLDDVTEGPGVVLDVAVGVEMEAVGTVMVLPGLEVQPASVQTTAPSTTSLRETRRAAWPLDAVSLNIFVLFMVPLTVRCSLSGGVHATTGPPRGL